MFLTPQEPPSDFHTGPDDSEQAAETRDDRAERQLAEGKEAVREAMGVMAYATRLLEKALTDLDQFGDPPMADLE